MLPKQESEVSTFVFVCFDFSRIRVITKLPKYCKENCIDRSVIEPIIIDFCDDDSDDDMG
jgi:hypothetical protein